MKIFIFGARGFFGQKFADFFKKKNWEICDERVDICDAPAVRKILRKTQPDVALNCAGKTGVPNVDWCEKNPRETFATNSIGPANIAVACDELKIFFANLSSGCIFAGDNGGAGFSENDAPNFFGSVYSRSKILAEKFLAEFSALQLRIRIPIDSCPHPKNVIDKLLKYDKILIAQNSFTVVDDFLPAAFELISQRARGIFNLTNPGAIDHKFLLENFRKICGLQKNFEFISAEKLEKMVVAPRSNCVLRSEKLQKFGIFLPEISARIPEIFQKYKIFFSAKNTFTSRKNPNKNFVREKF